MQNILLMLAYFYLYGMMGWLLMTLVHSICSARLVSAGLLLGPLCPSFGLTAALLIWLAPMISGWPPLVFIVGTLLAIVMDVGGAWIMVGLFKVDWWPAAKNGLHGITFRILKAMVAGLMGSLLIYVIHPLLQPIIASIPSKTIGLVVTVASGVFLLDALYSLDIMDKLVLKLHMLHAEMEHFDRLYELQDEQDLPALRRDIAWLRSMNEAGRLQEDEVGALSRIDKITALWKPGYRLISALPQMQPIGLENELAILRKAWRSHSCVDDRWLPHTIANIKAKIKASAKEMNPFAQGVGFYKLLWVFVVACVLGYLIETAFALVLRGVIESRAGMVYGPFNQVYGLGAVLMVVLLHPLAKKKDRWLFLASALLGGAYEFVCSWVQEICFGTVSWDYANAATSIGGRTNLLIMLCWGVLGVVFIKGIYPKLSALIERIPHRIGVILSWVIAVFLALNLALSAVAVGRWVGRQYDQPAKNGLDLFLDKQFPDETMEVIYPSMRMVEGTEPIAKTE